MAEATRKVCGSFAEAKEKCKFTIGAEVRRKLCGSFRGRKKVIPIRHRGGRTAEGQRKLSGSSTEAAMFIHHGGGSKAEAPRKPKKPMFSHHRGGSKAEGMRKVCGRYAGVTFAI